MEGNLTDIDPALFARLGADDEIAFEEIFHYYNQLHFPFVLSIIKSEPDAREVMQDVFLKVWLHRQELAVHESPQGWLKRVVVNTAYDALRKTVHYQLFLDRYGNMETAEGNDDYLKKIDLQDTREMIQEAVKQLPARRREIFRLAKLEGFSRKEIAERLGISENTVRNQLGEAMLFVEEYLKGQLMLAAPLSILLVILS